MLIFFIMLSSFRFLNHSPEELDQATQDYGLGMDFLI